MQKYDRHKGYSRYKRMTATTILKRLPACQHETFKLSNQMKNSEESGHKIVIVIINVYYLFFIQSNKRLH